MSWYKSFISEVERLFRSEELEGLRLAVLDEYYGTKIEIKRRRWPLPRMGRRGVFADSQAAFFTALFALLAKMAEADGAPTRDEIEALERFVSKELRLDSHQKSLAFQLFRKARRTTSTFQDLAKGYARIAKTKALRENMIFALLSIAVADGTISSRENQLIEEAANIFGLSVVEENRIRAHFEELRDLEDKRARIYFSKKKSFADRFQSRKSQENRTHQPRSTLDIPSHYSVLGCVPSDTLSQIKKSYRKLVLQHHPDRLMTKGLPKEAIQLAERRFREIQNAYDQIMKARATEQ